MSGAKEEQKGNNVEEKKVRFFTHRHIEGAKRAARAAGVPLERLDVRIWVRPLARVLARRPVGILMQRSGFM